MCLSCTTICVSLQVLKELDKEPIGESTGTDTTAALASTGDSIDTTTQPAPHRFAFGTSSASVYTTSPPSPVPGFKFVRAMSEGVVVVRIVFASCAARVVCVCVRVQAPLSAS